MGGSQPLRLQSMTNTPHGDINACFEQCVRILDAGAHYVRLSIPGKESIESFRKIKELLNKAGYFQPLIADIHFNPALAEMVAPFAAKVRINPGNYTDRIKGKNQDSLSLYQQEPEIIRKRIAPLVGICLEHGTAIRVGTNMGSLSERMIHKYGHTPQALVESTLEFLEILESLGFSQTVISLKASNPLVMIQAYRLMVESMQQKELAYPMHLGVTEAGVGMDGRIKSAMGISTLLNYGIGDTIRVSLTEDPEKEIPFAQKLIAPFSEAFTGKHSTHKQKFLLPAFNLQHPPPLPGGHKAIVMGVFNNDTAPDVIVADQHFSTEELSNSRHFVLPADIHNDVIPTVYPLFTLGYLKSKKVNWHGRYNFIELDSLPDEDFMSSLSGIPGLVLLPAFAKGFPQDGIDPLLSMVHTESLQAAVIPKVSFDIPDMENLVANLSTRFGSLLIQRKIHGIWPEPSHPDNNSNNTEVAFKLLQAAGVRITKTEFISCPTCARTSFDLQEVLRQVQRQCSDLPGIKIAIMGCVVNGPGEMADADYGILGTATGKVHIYKGKTIVKRNIRPLDAAAELMQVIDNKASQYKKRNV